MSRARMAVLAGLLLAPSALAGCGSRPPADTPGSPLSVPALKLVVLDAVGGHLEYCDPDLYPVAHGTPLQSAERRLPTIKADAATYDAILAHERITSDSNLTSEQKIAINQDYKQMQAIQLQPSGDGYRFTVVTPAEPADAGPPIQVEGTVDRSGDVRVTGRHPGQRPACPICLAAGVAISTPAGPIAVQDLRVGTPVWSTDRAGHRIRTLVVEVGHTPAPEGHRVIRLTLADGRSVLASPGHPTADGRRIGTLRPGDELDGSTVLSAVLVPYTGGSTYDLLPSGPTGTYFANGILLLSTLEPTR